MPCDSLPAAGSAAICEKGGSGLLLPLFGDSEQEWPTALRAVLYLLGLFWSFMGVAIVADVFMGAIEKVTSKRVLVMDKKLGKMRTKTVWNPTVANLTLMALGSSAPEILLNVIGIFPTFQSSDLGPSTIVGSAAFNLLVIIAVCVVSIPGGEIRKIKDMGVFACTAFFSVFAYLWLLVILMLISPDVVEAWEAIVTFLFFWVLVTLAFLADVGKLPGTAKPPSGSVVHPQSSPQELAEMQLAVRQKYGRNQNLNDEQVAALMQYEYYSPESRAKHRINATRSMMGGKKVFGAETLFDKGARIASEIMKEMGANDDKATSTVQPVVGFQALNYTVLESVGFVDITVKVVGTVKEKFSVQYATRGGTAKEGDDYEKAEGTLEFAPDKLEATIKVKIYKSEGHEMTEEFYVDLKEPQSGDPFKLGKHKVVTIVIIDEDLPGTLSFESDQIPVEASHDKTDVVVVVNRKCGQSGKISCKYATEADTAVADADFVATEGVLEFEDRQAQASFTVTVNPKARYEANEMFRVVLSEPTGGAGFDDTMDGGADSAILTFIIKADKEGKGTLAKLNSSMQINWDQMAVGNANYMEQFTSAIYVGGSKEEVANATALDWITHTISLPWKLLFAIIPPTEYCGGWVCFFCALIMIGFVTVIIGDMAELLGCVLKIKPAHTAITLVALGTSLPDTFASRTSAQQDPYADNSIGNVTGSNSVNVFLGLGLPWSIAAIYWQFLVECEPGDSWYRHYPDVAKDYSKGIFVVKAGSLAASVSAFCGCAVACIAVLVIRRSVFGGELGGPTMPAYFTAIFFVLLWAVYIVISIALGD